MGKIKKEFLTLSIKRSSYGVTVNAKSQMIEEFFNVTSKGTTNTENVGICYRDIYVLPQDHALCHFRPLLFSTRANLFVDSLGQPSVMFLRSVGMSEGIRVHFNQPITKTAVGEWLNTVEKGLIKFYKEYLKDINVKIHITVEEIPNDS